VLAAINGLPRIANAGSAERAPIIEIAKDKRARSEQRQALTQASSGRLAKIGRQITVWAWSAEFFKIAIRIYLYVAWRIQAAATMFLSGGYRPRQMEKAQKGRGCRARHYARFAPLPELSESTPPPPPRTE